MDAKAPKNASWNLWPNCLTTTMWRHLIYDTGFISTWKISIIFSISKVTHITISAIAVKQVLAIKHICHVLLIYSVMPFCILQYESQTLLFKANCVQLIFHRLNSVKYYWSTFFFDIVYIQMFPIYMAFTSFNYIPLAYMLGFQDVMHLHTT